ncbi:hypothetical protein BLNAU_15070 [Blattamonas nauphoetae]|uniref:Uncharacterized protein n=1 Tax=Blattamonas nauphoetae TaxID=2049346 RepID=A0ABQ9XIM6_9EUKA|nr:hypothetical protein BLNAU_15070 [Blattamonas nauphoetae]
MRWRRETDAILIFFYSIATTQQVLLLMRDRSHLVSFLQEEDERARSGKTKLLSSAKIYILIDIVQNNNPLAIAEVNVQFPDLYQFCTELVHLQEVPENYLSGPTYTFLTQSLQNYRTEGKSDASGVQSTIKYFGKVRGTQRANSLGETTHTVGVVFDDVRDAFEFSEMKDFTCLGRYFATEPQFTMHIPRMNFEANIQAVMCETVIFAEKAFRAHIDHKVAFLREAPIESESELDMMLTEILQPAPPPAPERTARSLLGPSSPGESVYSSFEGPGWGQRS